ncbi:PREDICTED: uncharacterized protein C16orf59 homolog isoform X3 [Capra hircus]|uniref:uncharacterized protein C16orf59 homolog isoform X3 n=1 Tax=Capra hircus TaxID=9925 RepID=UPI0008470CAE|nr:PREDICTED: uncharacterized protein C16orf59 homolog isoform X3 [Capra hircus]
MLPAECSRRLVAELRDALDSCAERQRQLEQSLRVSRRLLRVWEPAETPAPEPTLGPEINEEAPSSACPPSPQDLKELELLTQALEKAVRVRKGLSKAGEGVKVPSLKSGSASTATKASAPPSTSRCTGSRAPETKPPRGVHHPWVPAKDLPGHRLLLVGDGAHMGQGAGANKTEAGLRDQQIVPQAASQVPEAFTLKDKGCTGDGLGSALLSPRRTPAGLAPVVTLEALSEGWESLTPHWALSGEWGLQPPEWDRAALSASFPTGPYCGCQRPSGRRLPRMLAVVEQPQGLWAEGAPRAALPCGGGADPVWSPQLLLYSSTQELQTLAALRLRVAMLDQQVHLEKVLMAELLPLLREQEPLGRPWLALCRAAHCLLCEGGQHFLTVLQDESADRLSPP